MLLNVMHWIVALGINFIIRFASIHGCLCVRCVYLLTSNAARYIPYDSSLLLPHFLFSHLACVRLMELFRMKDIDHFYL